MYTVANPNEYLAVTGMGVKTVKITKACWVWPFQRCVRFSVQPHDYAMNLQAMTIEKLQCLLPTVFTVGPDVSQRSDHEVFKPHLPGDDDDDERSHVNKVEGDALMKYATLLSSEDSTKHQSTNDFLQNIVKGIVEGEVRVLVSSMSMEELFTEREVFKRRIFRNIQSELDQFGLKIYNANVKELRDAPNSEYFANLSRKAHEGASNQARIDVAAAQLRGNVGEAQRKGEQDREIAKINAETAVAKTERDVERASAEACLATRKTALSRDVDIAKIEATRATEGKDEDLKRQVQARRALAELERLRATDVVKATIARESKQQAADAKAYETRAAAEASFISAQKQAEASAYNVRVAAEAEAYRAGKTAEANLLLKSKEAEGVAAMARAYDDLAKALGGPRGLLQFLMIERGTYVELAKMNAEAVRGMAPKICLWNTTSAPAASSGGGGGGDDGESGGQGQGQGQDATAALRNVYQMLPPLMSTINEQTGITLPEWQFGRLNGSGGSAAADRGKESYKNGVNRVDGYGASMGEIEQAKAMVGVE